MKIPVMNWKPALCAALAALALDGKALANARPDSATINAAPATVRATTDAASLSLSRQFQAIRNGGGTSLASLQGLSFDASSLVAGSGPIVPRKSASLPQDNPWDFFASPIGTLGDIDPGPAAEQANFYSVGVLAGFDYRVSKDVAVGFYAGYDYTKTDYKASLASAHDNATRFGVFSSWKDAGGDWLQATLGGAYHAIQTRNNPIDTTIDAGSTDGMELDGSLAYGHDFKLGAWTLTPTVGVNYIRLSVDDYNEVGPGGTTSLLTQVTNSLRSELGGTVSYTVKAGSARWTPYVRGGWNHEFLDDSATTQFSSGLVTSSTPIDRETASFGLGVTAAFSPTLSWSLDYAGEANSYYQSHSFDTALHVAF